MLAFLFAALWLVQTFAVQYILTLCCFWGVWRLLGLSAAKVSVWALSLVLAPIAIATSLLAHLPAALDDVAQYYEVDLHITPFIAAVALFYCVLIPFLYFFGDEISLDPESEIEVYKTSFNYTYKVETGDLEPYYEAKKKLITSIGILTLLFALIAQTIAIHFVYFVWS